MEASVQQGPTPLVKPNHNHRQTQCLVTLVGEHLRVQVSVSLCLSPEILQKTDNTFHQARLGPQMLIKVQYLVALNPPLALARLAAALVHLEGEEPLANLPRRQRLGPELPLVCLGNLPPQAPSAVAAAFLERTNLRQLLGPLPRQVGSFLSLRKKVFKAR